MNRAVRFIIALSLLLSATSFPNLAAAQRQRAIVGTSQSTTITHPDGSKEVVTEDGKHTFYNFDGSPRGINKTCSSSGMSAASVSCHYWGPNSYGGKN